MKHIQFKTNLHCDGCVSKIATSLREVQGIVHWEVDLENPDKTLSVFGDEVQEGDIMKKVREAGYQIAPV